MRRSFLPLLAILLLSACGTDGSGGSGPGGSGDGNGGSGGSSGNGGSGGTGGGGGVDPAFTEVSDCADYDAERATDLDAFTLAGGVGVDLPVGTDAEAEVMGYDAGLTRLDFWSDDLGRGFEVRWPRALTLFVEGEVLRVTRTEDWLVLRSTVNDTVAVLHVSTGAAPPARVLEALPEGGPTMRFVPQCALPANATCRSFAVAVEATDGEETVTMPDGWPWGFHGSRWNIQPFTALRDGCGDDGYAAVIVGDGLLWM